MMAIIFWLFFSGAAAAIAQNKGRSGTGFFLLSFFLSPLIGIIAAFIAKPDNKFLENEQIISGTSKKCPHCAELIKKEALVCRYCGHDQIIDQIPKISPEKPSITYYVAGVVLIVILIIWGSVELVIPNYELQLLAILIPAFIYIDATNNKIGRIKEVGKSFYNRSAGEWGFFCILLLILYLPVYIWKRNYLKDEAVQFPVKVGAIQRILVTILLLICASALQWGFYKDTQASVTQGVPLNNLYSHDNLSSFADIKKPDEQDGNNSDNANSTTPNLPQETKKQIDFQFTSFHCYKARKSTLEVMICADPELSALDVKENKVYSKLREDFYNKNGSDSVTLENERQEFLHDRTETCPIPFTARISENDSKQIILCLKRLYINRVNRLENSFIN